MGGWGFTPPQVEEKKRPKYELQAIAVDDQLSSTVVDGIFAKNMFG